MESNPDQLVASFLSEYRASGTYSRDRVARLAELVTSENHQTAESATRAFFTTFVEQLADSFEPAFVSLYNRVFAQVIHACRRAPRASQLDLKLNEYGLRSEEDLVSRAYKVRQISPLTDSIDAGKVQRVVVLSRVTLGADVAITSVIIERMKLEFPAAEIVLVGGSKSPELFGGDPRVCFKEIRYHRAGTTVQRLLTWIDLLRCVGEVTEQLMPGEYLIVDPDSRLTQLGLLPIGRGGMRHHQLEQDSAAQQSDYLFFPSREYGSGTSRSLSELTSLWLDELFGDSAPAYPSVSLKRNDTEIARDLLSRMKSGSRPVVAINFGVGENQLKRVGGDFEARLVARLVTDGAAIVLDKGAGREEMSRANAIIAEMTLIEKEGRRVRAIEIDEQNLMSVASSGQSDVDILVWNGRIGMLAGLIGESDLYIGYDSAGQHIAAALGVKCIDVFSGFVSSRMLDRWRPTGPSETRIVAVDPLSGGEATQDVLSEVVRYACEILSDR